MAARIDPLRAARTEHAAALDAEIVRVGGVPSTAAPSAAPAAGTTGPAARPAAEVPPARQRPLPPRQPPSRGCGTPSRPRSAVPRSWCRTCPPSASASSRRSPRAARPTRRCSREQRVGPAARRGGGRMSGGSARLDDVAVGALAGRPGHRARRALVLLPRRRLPAARPGGHGPHRRRGAPRAARPDRGDAHPARAASGVRPACLRDPTARDGRGVGGRRCSSRPRRTPPRRGAPSWNAAPTARSVEPASRRSPTRRPAAPGGARSSEPNPPSPSSPAAPDPRESAPSPARVGTFAGASRHVHANTATPA